MATYNKRRISQEYWEARLTRMGLSPERGRHDWLTYGEDFAALDYDGKKTYRSNGGDERLDEWPLSLL